MRKGVGGKEGGKGGEEKGRFKIGVEKEERTQKVIRQRKRGEIGQEWLRN